METRQTTGDGYYECVECRETVPATSYRAACPDCGGRLRATPPPLGGP